MSIDPEIFLRMNVSMGIVLTIVIICAVIMLWLWQRDGDNNIEISDLVCKDGRLDEKKFTRLGAWAVSTWGFVFLIMDGKMSEWYFAGYMGAWVANAILDKYLNSRSPNLTS